MTEPTKKDNEGKEEKEGKTLSLSGKTLSLGKASAPPPRTSMTSGGRGAPSVAVEVRRKRKNPADEKSSSEKKEPLQLTDEERESRARALQQALSGEGKKKELPKRRVTTLEDVKAQAAEVKREESEKAPSKTAKTDKPDLVIEPGIGDDAKKAPDVKKYKKGMDEETEESFRDKLKKAQAKPNANKVVDDRRRGRLTVNQALNEDFERDRGPSLAAQRRAREKARLAAQPFQTPQQKTSKEIILPETITVQELAIRMAEPGGEVVKALMKLGVMATITQTIDADTAELIIGEFGHKTKRVTDADVEIGLGGQEDLDEHRQPRPPVVTIMGHVDHGKTSLLDALRSTDVVSGEAGGITQHIGAYQVQMSSGEKITFLDTPGHAAFTEMRARGANVTDIVVIVVAANDSIMPQTIEAISHAKAANVPIIIAINKVDLPDAKPQKVKQDLLQHEIIVEELSGEVQCVEVSAKKKMNLDKLEEAILIQAEILELKANANRDAEGFVIESKLEKGRGPVATVLVQKGTLKVGDIFVAGATIGKVRAMIDDKGQNITTAAPGQPVEVIGSESAPVAGDSFYVVKDESRAREIASYRQRKIKESQAALAVKSRTTMEDILQQKQAGDKTRLPVLIKADVHGSVEAIAGSLKKVVEENKDIEVQILHSGVGGITESDVILAKASKGVIIGFNVRANVQARNLAQREGVDIRYYNIIYNVVDDAKAILSGMLSPHIRENYLGQALIKQVFNITKVGKVAGCVVSIGNVKRGAKVRLLRDDVVIHEGMLKTLKRFQDEVKDVREGTECGMAFESYDDIKEGDVIECYELVEEERTLA
ncbi:MAG: translation initiation factor IF-2 [Alphaproteobacteria bacterium]|jgi:translation initiation factor IF-2|nr:translation initiation factor IF-2 [Alphaproteobacteria bacterium]QQS56514.1 MAG: translation initiation factor IF-2 [Alphaproteobacteria bacterium]